MSYVRAAVAMLIFSLLLTYGIVFYQLRGQVSEGYSDFISFYTAGRILQGGTADRLYDIGLQNEIQRELAPHVSIRKGALPFVRPAFEAWLFWPLAHLSYKIAFLLWTLFSCACLFAVASVLRSELLHYFSQTVMFAAMLSYFPVFVTLLQGQDSILLLLIYTAAYRALRKNSPLMSGMILGLGTFKFTLLVPFLFPFVARRQLRLPFGFAVTCLLLAAISVATVGWKTAAHYPRFLLSVDRLAPAVNVPKDMPNVRGLLSLLVPIGSATAMLLLVLLSLLLLALVVSKFSGWSAVPFFDLGFSLNLTVTVLVSYHCHSFDLSVLLLPIALVLGLLLSNQEITPRARKTLIWGLTVIAFSPLYIMISFGLNYTSLLAVALLVFTVALLVAISELPRRAKHGQPAWLPTDAEST